MIIIKKKPVIVFCVLALLAISTFLVVFYLNKQRSKPLKLVEYTGKKITNSWYSSLFFEDFSEPLFVYPSSYKLTGTGIEVSRTLPVFSENTIIATHNPDLVIKPADGQKFITKKIENIGIWDIRVLLQTEKGDTVYLHLTKGSPVLYLRSNTKLKIDGSYSTSTNPDYFEIKTAKNRYLISTNSLIPDNKQLSYSGDNSLINLTTLPDNFLDSNLKQISDCATNEPEITDYEFIFTQNNILKTTYEFTKNIIKGKYLFTIWPHQKNILATKINLLGSYQTPRGELDLACESNFSTLTQIENLPTSWSDFVDNSKISSPEVKNLFKEDMNGLLASAPPQGVYYKGKYIKDLVDLWETAKIIGLKDEEAQLEKRIGNLLINEINNFYLDDVTGLVMSKYPEFGNENGNDHHFQYSYWIYSYAKFFSNFSSGDQQKVTALITMFGKEGMPLKTDGFPTNLRFLDIMEGHSWADGKALFNDGNDQESSSEATFYWYSWYLWGYSTNNKTIQKMAKFAYFTELQGKMSYWFLVNNKLLSNNFDKPIVSLVWGGKADYATWFSPDEDKILGIQIIPLNPSSYISLKIGNASSLKKITDYYDQIIPRMKSNNNSFVNLYLFFKKVNGQTYKFNDLIKGGEYIQKSLLYILK